MAHRSILLSEIAAWLDVPLHNADLEINGLGLCNRKTVYPSILSYITSLDYLEKARWNANVKALLLTEEQYSTLSVECKERFSFLLSNKPEDDFYRLHEWLYASTDFYEKKTFSPVIGRDCKIHRSAVIEDGVVIGDRVSIGPNSIVERNSRIGNDVYIGSHSVIGCAGFQILRTKEGRPYNSIHVGGTLIGNKVWIGNHVNVSKALFEGDVQIGDNVQIANMCDISHNCVVGENSVLCSNVVLLGSCVVGADCWLSPKSVIMNRLTVGKGAMVGVHATVTKDVLPDSIVMGSPAVSRNEFINSRTIWKRIEQQGMK